jgi:hypothetical protein
MSARDERHPGRASFLRAVLTIDRSAASALVARLGWDRDPETPDRPPKPEVPDGKTMTTTPLIP